MWLLRTLLLTVVVAALVIVAVQNSEPLVDVRVFGWEVQSVRLFLVMFLCGLVGFVAGLLVAGFRELKLRLRLGDERKQKTMLEREVRELRAAPLQGLGEGDAPTLPARRE